MGFSWRSAAVGDKVDAADINEVKTNTDTVLASLSTSFTWTELPVVADTDMITEDQWQELRDAIDHADDNNTCSTYNNDKNTSVDSDQHGSYDSGQDTTVYSYKDSTVYSSN